MKSETKNTKSPIVNEGNNQARVTAIDCSYDETRPNKYSIGFAFEGKRVEHVEHLRGLNEKLVMMIEILQSMINLESDVLVLHKAGAGGKTVPAASVILGKATTTVSQPAAA